MTKIELFDEELQTVSSYFKAMGHPARLAILNYLITTGVCISGDISQELPLSRTTVNQHLKELKDINMIKGEIEGSHVNYCLNTKTISQIIPVMESFLEKLKSARNTNCN